MDEVTKQIVSEAHAIADCADKDFERWQGERIASRNIVTKDFPIERQLAPPAPAYAPPPILVDAIGYALSMERQKVSRRHDELEARVAELENRLKKFESNNVRSVSYLNKDLKPCAKSAAKFLRAAMADGRIEILKLKREWRGHENRT
jgi:hypothetical protein